MKRLCVICEGHTEAQFVKECLEPHLRQHGLVTVPSLLKSGPGRPGGRAVSVERLARHASHEYHHFDHVTTWVDYYGFGRAGGRTKPQLEADLVEEVRKRVSGFDPRRFLPYVQMHEFEALLFSCACSGAKASSKATARAACDRTGAKEASSRRRSVAIVQIICGTP